MSSALNQLLKLRTSKTRPTIDRGFHKPPRYSTDIFINICNRFGVELTPPDGKSLPLDDQQREIINAILAVQVVSRDFFKRFFAFYSPQIERDILATGYEFCRILMVKWIHLPFHKVFTCAALVMELYLYAVSNRQGLVPKYTVFSRLLHMVLMQGLGGGVLTFNERDSSVWRENTEKMRQIYFTMYEKVSPGIDGLIDPYDSFSNKYVMGEARLLSDLVISNLSCVFNFERGRDLPSKVSFDKEPLLFIPVKTSEAQCQAPDDLIELETKSPQKPQPFTSALKRRPLRTPLDLKAQAYSAVLG